MLIGILVGIVVVFGLIGEELQIGFTEASGNLLPWIFLRHCVPPEL